MASDTRRGQMATPRGRKGRPPRQPPTDLALGTPQGLRGLIGVRIQSARMAKQMTLAGVAKRVEAVGRGYKISPAHISRIENGEAAPNIIDLYWLNEVLDRPFGPLLAGVEAPWFIVRSAVAEQRLGEVV